MCDYKTFTGINALMSLVGFINTNKISKDNIVKISNNIIIGPHGERHREVSIVYYKED